MKLTLKKLIFLSAVALVTTVTVIGDSSAGVHLMNFVQLIPGKDVTGHFCLYAGLGTATSFFLQRTEKNSNFLWFGIISALVVAEEFSQMFIPHRTFSLIDLAASIAGLWIGFSTFYVYSICYRNR